MRRREPNEKSANGDKGARGGEGAEKRERRRHTRDGGAFLEDEEERGSDKLNIIINQTNKKGRRKPSTDSHVLVRLRRTLLFFTSFLSPTACLSPSTEPVLSPHSVPSLCPHLQPKTRRRFQYHTDVR